jgi:hypothetical protein
MTTFIFNDVCDRFLFEICNLWPNTDPVVIKKIWENPNINNIKSRLIRGEKKKKISRKERMKEYNPKYSYKVDELKVLCKKKGYTSSGKRQFLIDQLAGNIEPKLSKLSKPKGYIGGIELDKKQKERNLTRLNKVVSRLKEGIVKFKVSRNEYGNYQHIDSNLVIDINKNKVIGVQEGSELLELSCEDIELCRKYNVDFILPRSVRTKTKNTDHEHGEEVLTKEDYEDIDEMDDV